MEKETNISINNHPSVSDKLKYFGCLPVTSMAVLPVNFAEAKSIDELRQSSNASTIKSLFRINKIHLDIINEFSGLSYVHNNSIEWVAPTIFIAGSIISGDPAAVSLALGVLTNYLTDMFKGIPKGREKVKIDIVVEAKDGMTCKKISYEGSVKGVAELSNVITKVFYE